MTPLGKNTTRNNNFMKGGEKCHAEKVDFETHTNSDKRSKKTEGKKERKTDLWQMA